MNTVLDRFLKFITYETTSLENTSAFPSTEGQLQFAKMLLKECEAVGLSHCSMDSYGYVTAEIASNVEHALPTIAFLAHMDTSPDASGKNVFPLITENYDGGVIYRKGAPLDPAQTPNLLDYKGETIISSDGTTLLGADDKAGIAEILTAMEHLIRNPKIKHGAIKIAFTPDEEVGRGTNHFDVNKFGADFAYTVDGGRRGELEYENFNAARAVITIEGKSVHPGTAKGVMKNASLIALTIASRFPENETPATTEGRQGFYHLCGISGGVSSATLTYNIRDFDKANFESRKNFIKQVVDATQKEFGTAIDLKLYDEYQNMASCFEGKEYIIDLGIAAYKQCNITPLISPIRGGTDGARLSFMGLACPNLFTGGHNFHGPLEFIPVLSMEKAVDCIVQICTLATEFFKK